MGLTDSNSTTIPRIMVFRPTLEEMKDFSKYLEYMESQGANKAGLAKIIPPPEWCPRKGGYDDINITIKAPIQQLVTGGQGLYQQYNIQKKSMNIKDFKKMAESQKYSTPQFFDYEDLERKYWKNVTFNPAIYGADVPGTLTDEDCKEFNINNLNTILDMINESYGIKIMGVNTAYLYFGMWKTTFAWHTEDMDLYSINYLHFGAPKSWYCIPPEHGKRLERLANGFFPNSYKTCPAFLRHKMTLISPQVLKKYSIPFNKITQESGEFMITFPYAYHAGYNHGYNCAESTNFALPRWVEFGKRALRCLCRPDAVKISMEAFVKKFQPDRYELWLEGKDIGPDPKDLSHICAAPAPSSYELNVMSKFNKHKRHPPHKKDYSSDTEEYATDDECSEIGRMFTPPTKAARKMFETGSEADLLKVSMAPSIAAISPDAISSMPKPPSISDTILRLHKNLIPEKSEKKKRKKRSNETAIPPHLLNHSYAKPNGDSCVSSCTQPNANHTNHDFFAQFFLNNSTILNNNSNSFQSKIKSEDVNNASYSQSFPELLKLTTKSESLSHSQPFSYNNDVKKFSPEVFQNQSFANYLGSDMVRSEVKPKDGQQVSVESQQMVPPNIIPYYEYSSVDNLSPSSQPPLLNPQEFSLSSILNDGHLNDRFLSTYGSHQLTNASKSSDQKMVEASTSTEDLDGLNHINHSFNTFNHSNNSSMILEELSQKTLQYAPPTFGPSPEGFADEIKFNLYMSTIEPHCAVCNLLRPFELNQIMNLLELDSWSPPKSSSILIPSIAFTSKVKDESTLLDSRESSPLIVCMDCRVCVHSVCYGASDLLFDGSERNWRCDRCEKKEYFALCSLCPLRGGPLKETTDKKWVHLSCALLVPDVQFVNGIAKRPIDLSDLKAFRKSERMGCVYCRKIHPENKMVDYLTGYCIQCTTGNNCYTSFHVTCGHRQGVLYQAGDWPDPIVVTCKKCSQNSQSKKKQFTPNRNLKEVEPGEIVIAKHKNKRFYNSKVIDKFEQVFHHVHFVDNSFTKNIKSCDILNRDCEKDPPEIGDAVEVIWNKEQLHGKYTGNHSCSMYTIGFDDGSFTKVKRDDFYLLTDELPKRVQYKLSSATDRQYLLSDDSSNSKQ